MDTINETTAIHNNTSSYLLYLDIICGYSENHHEASHVKIIPWFTLGSKNLSRKSHNV